MGEGLLRQRRNLLTVCVLLWVMKYGGVTFTKFSLVGFDVTFANPTALTTVIWIAFAYFFYRYYQYFTDEGITKLTEVFTTALNTKCHPTIIDTILANNEDATHLTGYDYSYLKANNWKYKWMVLLTAEELRKLGRLGNPSFDNDMQERSIEITPTMLKKQISKAILDSIFRHSVVTDYLLPFGLALWVLYYCGSNDWSGSFLKIYFN